MDKTDSPGETDQNKSIDEQQIPSKDAKKSIFFTKT